MLDKFFEQSINNKVEQLLNETTEVLKQVNKESEMNEPKKPTPRKKKPSYTMDRDEDLKILPPDRNAWQHCGHFISDKKNCNLAPPYFCGKKTNNCCCFCNIDECKTWINSCEYLTIRIDQE